MRASMASLSVVETLVEGGCSEREGCQQYWGGGDGTAGGGGLGWGRQLAEEWNALQRFVASSAPVWLAHSSEEEAMLDVVILVEEAMTGVVSLVEEGQLT
ncbi:hypothetical protein CYMTET_21383 [Cymbomonas tetramitiformis]|uniref:Uncharacterized protein n=1 Tax=Cymbomonas tetramitiformis TaxID=36881 RepID=A0AAE0L2X9_9CHLO|nr:hypothetical protein CYMTET_21383 [Cymbomonas tetramitiformis]